MYTHVTVELPQVIREAGLPVVSARWSALLPVSDEHPGRI